MYHLLLWQYPSVFFFSNVQVSAADTIHTGSWTWGPSLLFIKISAYKTDYGPMEGEVKITVHAGIIFFYVLVKCEFEQHRGRKLLSWFSWLLENDSGTVQHFGKSTCCRDRTSSQLAYSLALRRKRVGNR